MFHVRSVSDRVALLRMDDGKVNAIGPAFLDGWPAAWADATAGGRAVVVTGNARTFSAGLDLKVLPTLGEDGLADFFTRFVAWMVDAYTHEGPVVTAVDGPALAGGAITALFGDVRVGTERARIGLTEMPVGIPFPPPVIALARNEVAASALGPALFQGRVSQGADARNAGWLHDLVPADALEDDAVRVAEELASFNARAYGPSKARVRAPVRDAADAFDAAAVDAYVADLVHEDTVNAIMGYFARVTAKKE